MRVLTSAVFLLPFLAFGGFVSSEYASQSTTGIWESDRHDAETSSKSEQEINITHELVGESIVQSTTERSEVTTAESDLNNMSQKNRTDNDLSKDNITQVIVENDSVLENDTGNKYISKKDDENTDQGTTESTSFDLERITTVKNVLTNQETTIFPSRDISLEDSSNVQNSGQMVNKTKAESTPTEDSISTNDQSSSSNRNSTPRSGRNGNDHKERLQTLPLSYKNKPRFSGHQKSLIKDYLFSDKLKSIDLLSIFKLILEKETLDLDSMILDLVQSAASDGSVNWNVIHNIIALCLKSKGLSTRVYDLPRNWYNQPIPLLQPDVLPKTAFAEYLISVEQPIESTWLPVGSNIDTPMLDIRDRKEFETSLIDIYETEVNPLTEMTSSNPLRIDHLRPCWKTQRNCFSLGDKILCKSKVICKPSVIENKGPVKKSGFYNLHNIGSNLEDSIPNLDRRIFSLKTAIPLLKNLIPFLKNNIPLLQNVIPVLKNALLLIKDQRYKYAGYEDEMDGLEALLRFLIEAEDEVQNQIKENNVINHESLSAKVLSDDIIQALSTKPGILKSKGSAAEITPDTITALPPNVSSATYANPINGGNPMFDTNTIDDATGRFSTSEPQNTNLTVDLNPVSDNLNSLSKLLNDLNNLDTLNSFNNDGSAFAKGDRGGNIEGNKYESVGSKESVQRALTSKPITGGSNTLPTLSVSTKPLSVSMNQSVLNEITPTLKSAGPVESRPVATTKQSETVYPSVGQLVSLSNQSSEGSVSDSEANSGRASVGNSLINQEYQSANFKTKVGNINTNLNRIKNTNLSSDLNINAISKINNILNAAGMNSSGISVNNSLEGIHQSLTTKPESTNSQHVRLNSNQDSNVNINQDENVSKLERGSIEQPMQEPIKMQLLVSSQAEHQSSFPGNTGIAGWNAKQDGSLNENRNHNTNVNQNVNTNQVNIAGLTRDLNPMLASSDMSVNSSNDINRIIPDGVSNMVGNVGLSRRTNSEVGFQGQQISEGQTVAQGVSVGDAVASNTNLNYNSNVNSDYNANLKQGDSLKMPESIRDIPTPTQSSEPVAVVQKRGKMNTNSHNNDGVDSNFRAHANFKLNLGNGFGIIKNILTKNPILSGGIISKRFMNLTPKDQNLQGNVTNQNQNESQNLNLNQTQNLNESQNPYQSQNQSAKQSQNSKEYSNQNLNKNRYTNLDQNGNHYQSQSHVSNQPSNRNGILHQDQFLNHNQKMNQIQNIDQDRNLNQNSNQNEKIKNSNQYLNQNLNADLNQKENQTQNQKRNQIQEQNANNYQNQNSNPDTHQNLNQIDIHSQNQILNQLPKRDQIHHQSQLNHDQYSNQNLNQEFNLNINSNSNQSQFEDQIQNQNQAYSQNPNQYPSQHQNLNQNMNQDQYSNQKLNQNINPRLNQNRLQDQIQNQNQVQNQIWNQYPRQNENVNQNLNQDLNQNSNDNEYQNQVQNQNQFKQQNTNQYLSQNQNLNNNMSQDQYSNQNLNQELNQTVNPRLNQNQFLDQIQNQNQFHNRNANQYLNQNQDVNQNLNEDLNQNLNTKQNLKSNDSEYQKQIQTKNKINQQNTNQYLSRRHKLIQDLSQNLNKNLNLKEIQGLNQNHKQYQNEIQVQSQGKNGIENQHFSQNKNQNVKPIVNENQNQNQIQNLNVNQDLRRNLNMNQNLDPNRYQKQNQYLRQDQIQNFTQNQNQNQKQNLVQNVNQNKIQTSNVNIPDKSQEKHKGWYELWYNVGEGKDDWTEIWNNKMSKRFRRETNHFY